MGRVLRIRFSLRTLLIAALLAGGAGLIWANWGQQWVLTRKFEGQCCGIAADGKFFAVTHAEHTYLIDLSASDRKLELEVFHGAKQVSFSNNGERIAATGETSLGDSVLTIWNRTVNKTLRMEFDYTSGYPGLLSPNGKYVSTAQRGRIRWFEITDAGLSERSKKPQGLASQLSSRSFSSDSRRIVTCGLDNTARIYDLESGELCVTIKNESKELCLAMFLFDTAHVITASTDRSVCIWNCGESEPKLIKKWESAGVPIVSPDGTRVVLLSHRGFMSVFDSNSGEICGGFGFGEGNSLCYSSDGHNVTRTDNFVCILDSNDGHIVWDSAIDNLTDARLLFNDRLMIQDSKYVQLWHRRRPEQWWGVAWLAEFWVTVAFGIAFLWSLRRDWVSRGT